MAIEGMLEVIQNGKSRAQRVKVASLASIPEILANNFGITSVTAANPVTVGTVTSEGAWTGSGVIVRLWRDIPFEETAIGKALASGEIDPLNPGSE